MTKTIEQWLQENLTPEQFENAKKCKLDGIGWHKKLSYLSSAIVIGFDWGCMPEGIKYWNDLCDKLDNEF